MSRFMRPIVAFDFDGVIRVPNAPSGGEYRENILTAEIGIRRSAFPAQHHSAPIRGENGLWRDRHSFSGCAVD